jgi:hypothetical protein
MTRQLLPRKGFKFHLGPHQFCIGHRGNRQLRLVDKGFTSRSMMDEKLLMQLGAPLSLASGMVIRSCERPSRSRWISSLVSGHLNFGGMNTDFTSSAARLDVYNMQLSNEPAEELARILIDSGKGAFELCGFFAGGACSCQKYLVGDSIEFNTRLGSETMEGAIKLARQVSISFSDLGSSFQ